MNIQDKDKFFEEFNNGLHRLGRVSLIAGVIILLGVPFAFGMICGVSKEYMVEYSFILGIPAIIVANIVELKDAVASGAELEFLPTIIGVLVAAVVGVACIKLLQWILKKDMWKYFGFYCFFIGIVAIICSIFGI